MEPYFRGRTSYELAKHANGMPKRGGALKTDANSMETGARDLVLQGARTMGWERWEHGTRYLRIVCECECVCTVM